MISSKEKSEDELKRIESQLQEINIHTSNIQRQIRENQNPNSMYFNNLLSQLDHLMK